MADDTQTQPATPAAEPQPFTHHISVKQYLQGLRDELATAIAPKHKQAVQAEIDAVLAAPTAPAE